MEPVSVLPEPPILNGPSLKGPSFTATPVKSKVSFFCAQQIDRRYWVVKCHHFHPQQGARSDLRCSTRNLDRDNALTCMHIKIQTIITTKIRWQVTGEKHVNQRNQGSNVVAGGESTPQTWCNPH